ncbi:unnamed protein product [Symbiodinium sp. CCMP2592]|nr:unnamed protein product [Symbiodinium sp. CCMP2592]
MESLSSQENLGSPDHASGSKRSVELDDAQLPVEKHAKTNGPAGADVVRLLGELPDSPTKTALLAILATPPTAVPAIVPPAAMPSPAGDPAAVPPQGVIPTVPSPAGDPARAVPPQGVIPAMPSPPGDPAAVPPQGVIPAEDCVGAVPPQGVIPAMPSPPGDPAAVPPEGVIPSLPSPARDPVPSNAAPPPAGSIAAVLTSLSAVPSQATAPVLPAPPTLPQAPSAVQDQALVPSRGGGGWLCNSKTHAAEWKSYGRWVARNPDATQLSAAYNKGADARLAAFQKWVHSGGNGKAVEACMRMVRSSEELHRDSGRYVPWTAVLQHFRNDATQAMDFAARRRGEEKGVSKCRNTGQETFLLFNDETREWTDRKLDEVAIEVGADLEAATQLAHLISSSPQLFRRGHDDMPRDNEPVDDGEADKQIHVELPALGLENFESQERLCELINQSKEGMSTARKDHPGLARFTETWAG